MCDPIATKSRGRLELDLLAGEPRTLRERKRDKVAIVTMAERVVYPDLVEEM